MNSHRDSDALTPFQKGWLGSLKKDADDIHEKKLSQITGGVEGEQSLAEWSANDVGVRQLPDDRHGILRISIGGGSTPLPLNYCVFRGDRVKCIDLLQKALRALEIGE